MFVADKIGAQAGGPPGCNPPRREDRMPVLKVVSGDTWTVEARLSAADGGPASPRNSHVEFVLSENQFSPPIWTGTWMSGIVPDENVAGLVRVRIPREATKALRRGSYMFSVRVSDLMRYSFRTQLKGNFLVEYMPTSDHHSIPYRDGTQERADVSTLLEEINKALERIEDEKVDKNALAGKELSLETVEAMMESMERMAGVLGAKIVWRKE